MAKTKQTTESTKTTATPTSLFQIFLIPQPSVSDADLEAAAEWIKSGLKYNGTVKILNDNLPTDEHQASKNSLLVDVSEKNWKQELELAITQKISLESDRVKYLSFIDAKGRESAGTAVTIVPKNYWISSREHQTLPSQLSSALSGLLATHPISKEPILTEKLNPEWYAKKNILSGLKSWLQEDVVGAYRMWRSTNNIPWLFKFLFHALLIISLLYSLIGAVNVGVSSDEHRYLGQAEKVFNFYKTFGKDTTANTKAGVDPQYFNGQILDNVMYTIGKPFGLEKNFTFRHILNSIVGWIGIVFAALLALRFAGYRAGVFALLLMMLSPIYMGNVFNNHRDIPLATFAILGIYSIVRFWDYYPKVNRKYLIYTVLALALSFASRLAGGVLLTALMGLYSLLKLIDVNALKKLLSWDKTVRRPVLALLAGLGISYVLALLCWPYGLTGPIAHSLEVIKSSGNHPVALYQIFESNYTLSSNMPDYYVMKYVFVTIPIAVWIGVVLLVYLLFTKKTTLPRWVMFFSVFTFAFPLVYSYFKLGNVYGSWRQFLFIFPFIAVCSAWGWDQIINLIPRLHHHWMSVGLLLLTLIHPLQYVLRNHPFEYLYYNEITGGTRGAYSKYEWDYSLNSLKQGSAWLQDYIRKTHPKGTKLVIASNGANELAHYFKGFDDSVSTVYTRYYERGSINWDYAIFPNMYIHPYQLKNNVFPKADSLHFIKIDGKPLCFIYKRNNKDDLAAMQAVAANDPNTALTKFNSFLRHNPRSEWAWFQIGYIYAQNNNWQQSQTYVTESFKHHPEFLPSRALQGLIYLNTGKPKDAQPIFAKLITDKYDLFNTYKWSGMTYEADKNWRKALEQYGFALGAGNNQKDLYTKIANCFRQLGDQGQAAKYEAMGK